MKMFDKTGKEVNVGMSTMAYAQCKLQAIIEGFSQSNEPSVELVPEAGEYASMTTAASAVRASVRNSMRPYTVTTKRGHMYLTKTW